MADADTHLGEYITSENMGDREPWDFYTVFTNEYIGIEWRPGDYDDALYKNPSEEDPRMYRPGGYHPVRIGETYDDRYLVIRKLGWGVQSTVWLARDLCSSSYVALKMLQSKRIAAMEETEVLDILAQDTFAWNHVGERRGVFVHEGPYGRHLCIVFEVLGSTVRDLVKVDRHDGRRYYPLDSKPIKASISDDFVIKLVDFGSAQKTDGTTALWPVQPQPLRAPEVILDGGWGTPADIWNFACLIYELYSGQILFESPQQTEIPPIYIQLAQMQSICGSFSDELLRKGRLTSRYFDPETGEIDGISSLLSQ
ncbi:hypothetical protein FRC04_006245 [Tulasnella sp. 424]|nr:hypothetical protein FRC04_006245 [Tulasnella sp. 424]KAG8961105.1 hypothetical protein FRC05_006378 [Tulasnella sp. 425]